MKRIVFFAALAWAACSPDMGSGPLPTDGGPSVRSDAGAAANDADGGPIDAGSNEEGSADSGVTTVDSGLPNVDAGQAVDAGRPTDAGSQGVDAGSQPVDAGRADAGVTDGGRPVDAGTSMPDSGNGCGSAKLCESFESYPTGNLSNNTNLGPWRVRVADNRGAVSVDSARAASGQRALKVRIESGAASGGRIQYNAAPLFAMPRGQLYGRMKIFLGADGSSVHWTMFSASGTVPPGSAASGHRTNYLYSSFQQQGTNKNVFGAVFSDNQTGQDCYQGTSQLIPTNRWACVAFSFDGVAQRYRLWLDGAAVPSASVNTTGAGCVSHPPQTPWYGPRFDEFYIGAWSWHPMTAPLEFWVDDLVLDDQPVSCP
jgi:hypothetical protein